MFFWLKNKEMLLAASVCMDIVSLYLLTFDVSKALVLLETRICCYLLIVLCALKAVLWTFV